MIGEIMQLFPLVFLTVLAFWRYDWLKGALFLIAAADSLTVALTWRQVFPGAGGLGTSVVLFALFVFLSVCFVKVLISKATGQSSEIHGEAEGEEE